MPEGYVGPGMATTPSTVGRRAAWSCGGEVRVRLMPEAGLRDLAVAPSLIAPGGFEAVRECGSGSASGARILSHEEPQDRPEDWE